MQKQEKIIILFSLFFFFKKKNTYNLNYYCSKFFKKNIYLVQNFGKLNSCVFVFQKNNWYLLNNNLFMFRVFFKVKCMYFCVKSKKRSIVISIYYKSYLLFNIFQSFAKKIRSNKKLQKIYKKKNIEFGVRRHRKKLNIIGRIKRRLKFINNLKIKVKIINFSIKVLLKFCLFLSINKINICFFKNDTKICNKKSKKLYQRKRHKILKIKIFKKIKKLSHLQIFKNSNFFLNIFFSNNFSHSKNLLKVKRKRSR